MECAAPDFTIMWDDAYTVHYLGDAPAKQKSLIEACAEAGNPNRAYVFGSTSKITFPGSGIAVLASSVENIKYSLSYITAQTIGNDKLNQLRHANFLKDYDGIVAHMEKHAEILRPKFNAVLEVLEEELGGLGILEWTKPQGGYFVSINTLDGCATKVVAMANACGVKFTPAGATFPYRKDPRDRNIRIAPTLPPLEELYEAIRVLCVCIKICSAEKLLEA
jgi:DNA-binding transcriptional MocR family regulator